HRPGGVELVVAEHDPHVAAVDPAPLGEVLPVQVLGLVDAVFGDGRRPGDGGVDADDDLLVGDAVAVVRIGGAGEDTRRRGGPGCAAGGCTVGGGCSGGRGAGRRGRRGLGRAGRGRAVSGPRDGA